MTNTNANTAQPQFAAPAMTWTRKGVGHLEVSTACGPQFEVKKATRIRRRRSEMCFRVFKVNTKRPLATFEHQSQATNDAEDRIVAQALEAWRADQGRAAKDYAARSAAALDHEGLFTQEETRAILVALDTLNAMAADTELSYWLTFDQAHFSMLGVARVSLRVLRGTEATGLACVATHRESAAMLLDDIVKRIRLARAATGGIYPACARSYDEGSRTLFTTCGVCGAVTEADNYANGDGRAFGSQGDFCDRCGCGFVDAQPEPEPEPEGATYTFQPGQDMTSGTFGYSATGLRTKARTVVGQILRRRRRQGYIVAAYPHDQGTRGVTAFQRWNILLPGGQTDHRCGVLAYLHAPGIQR